MCDEQPIERQVAELTARVERLTAEIVDLRMAQRKVVLEELASLERPLIEAGVIHQRTRPPRHGPSGDDAMPRPVDIPQQIV